MKGLCVLFIGVGRRVELVQAFKDASARLGIQLRIIGADMAADAPALAFCDEGRLVCGMRDQGYVPQLLEICESCRIDLVIPTIDTDLRVLAARKREFEAVGTRVMVSAPGMVAQCRDKSLTAGFFRECGLLAPETVDDAGAYEGPYPCFVKPKDGSSSIGANRADSPEELRSYAGQLEEYVVQPFVEGDEYTVDIMCDFDGNPISIVPRQRLAVRSGEVLKTRICMDARIVGECEQLVGAFRPCGPLTVQLIRERATGEDWFIEINPRFGGGAPLSMEAGADSAEAILRLLRGERVARQTDGIADKAVYSRFDQCICAERGMGRPMRGVAFDLDDTLYPEADYVRSGFAAVARALPDVADAEERLWCFFRAGEHAIDRLLEEEGLLERKGELLERYRWHAPSIALPEESRRVLAALRGRGCKVGIVTDGRSEGQRAKVEALGLEGLVDDVIVTDELGGPQFRKPCDIAFRVLQRRWGLPFAQMAYVGDNPAKDFQAPRQLGMTGVWLRNPEGLYSRAFVGRGLADCEVCSIGEVAELFREVL